MAEKVLVNKNKYYPLLNAQQLLSLIRANQILQAETDERLLLLEKKVKALESIKGCGACEL